MEETTYIDLQESTIKNIWRIAWPVMVSSVLATTLTTVDMFWIGKLGAREVAAVALSGSVWFVVVSFAQVIAAGTLALVARYAGGGRSADLSLAIEQSLLLALMVAAPIGGLGWRFTPVILKFFGAEAAVLALGIPYLQVLFSGAIFVYLSIVAFTTMYALGDTRTPMRITMVTTIVNILLDPLLIFGWLGFPRLGVLGAGVATLVAYGLSFSLGLGILLKRGILKFARFKFHPATVAKILQVGLPASLQAITRPLTGMLMFKIVAYFGTAGIAAFGIGGRALGLMFIYLEGLGAAARTGRTSARASRSGRRTW
jgi:putative MATE family efflux protein